jgi:sugar O-acyltransferase (sialic acid O-acetyltransferase NeuD family)
MYEIILIGAGGHARSCIDVIELSTQFKIIGLVDKVDTNSQENLGYPIIGTDDDLPDLRQKYRYALVTIGQIKSSDIRMRLFHRLQELDYHLPAIISPRAYISKHAQIGDGTIVLHDAIVNANARIGENCIINNKALIEHDAVVGDHCHISTGAILNGEVIVGNKSFIGSGTVSRQSVSIGSNCVIGAGVVINMDVESNKVIKN